MRNNIYILPDLGEKINRTDRIAVAINFYYEKSLNYFLKYVKNIPHDIDIYFFSANENIIEVLKSKYEIYSNIFIEKKENRGRDISALLVAFKPYVNKYSFFCFLHDKKERYEYLKEDVHLWCENLWGNMIFSEGYIKSAIDLLKNKNYGVLMPPHPIGDYMDIMYTDAWGANYDNMVRLAQKLGLNIAITGENKEFMTIGSVFWCNVEAMKKLFSYNWNYEDFLEEPLPNDGTISHAIERILGFVALDAGYEVGTIMNNEYASKLNHIMQTKLEMAYSWLQENIGVRNSYQLEQLELQKKKVIKICDKYSEIYLYGAGYIGQMYLKRLEIWGCTPLGFVVSDGQKKETTLNGLKIYELHEIIDSENLAIIIAVGHQSQKSIINNLKKRGIKNYYILSDCLEPNGI